MTDRELLELAAKALGAPDLMDGAEYGLSGMEWNPLEDDGDALRLAAKLSIELQWRADGRVVAICYPWARHGHWAVVSESSREDRAANARRAIVRVAAEIGGATP